LRRAQVSLFTRSISVACPDNATVTVADEHEAFWQMFVVHVSSKTVCYISFGNPTTYGVIELFTFRQQFHVLQLQKAFIPMKNAQVIKLKTPAMWIA
jgi:hypothetical protein